jgi:hypothetical protein
VGSNLGAIELFSGPDQNIYAVYLDLKTRTSQVRRFKAVGSGNTSPVVKASVSPTSGDIPLVVSARASGSYDPDGQAVTFLWDFGDGKTSTDADVSHVYSNVGTYEVKVTVTEASAPFASSSDSFTVRSGLKAPVARIVTPTFGTQYEIGKEIQFYGEATTDSPEKLSLSWSILQIHNQHTHLVSEIDGASGTFTPTEHSDNTAYELCLVASIGEGLTDQKCVKLAPRVTPYVFSSEPSGATINYLDEEQDVVAPHIAYPIVGSEQSIRAPNLYAGRSFIGWSDGFLSPVRTFLTQTAPQTMLALYKNTAPNVIVSQIAEKNLRRRRFISLDASASRDPEGEPISYLWRFSDGKRYTSSRIRRSFARDGRFGLILTIRDSLGASITAKRVVIVNSRRGTRLR